MVEPEIAEKLDERGIARVGALEGRRGFRYLRLREPPYADEALPLSRAVRERCSRQGFDVYAYFRHEDEPTAPRYAERLLELVRRRAT